jgi:hypothetical protein
MRPVTFTALLAAALLIGAVPAVAQTPSTSQTPLTTPPVLGTPAAPDTKDSYLKNAQDELVAWKHDVDDFAARAKASGQEASQATARQLNEAWARAKVEGDKLATATADGWDRTRASFEAASRAFSDTFNKSKTPAAPKS